MIVGDPSVFAIESGVLKFVPRISQRALGFFVIHVGGKGYGVNEPDASMLGCSFEEVSLRLERRGTHSFSLLDDIAAGEVAEGYLDGIWRDVSRTDHFGLSAADFKKCIYSNAVIWAPDGDEAFDDGSHVLQFDVGDKVRLIAFVNRGTSSDLLGSLREQWLDAEFFYGVLSRWKTLFAEEWARAASASQLNTSGA